MGFPNDGANNYPYTDLHMLMVSDISHNSAPGNLPLNNCPAGSEVFATLAYYGQGGAGQNNYRCGNYWQVWDKPKGNVARALFYMDIRYEGGTHGVTGVAERDLILTDNCQPPLAHVGYLVDSFLRKGDTESSGPGIGYTITMIVCDILFGIVASVIVAWFSRQREFRAGAGAASLMGSPRPMINALARLGGMSVEPLPKSLASSGIVGGSSWVALFASHPSMEQRIAALQAQGR